MIKLRRHLAAVAAVIAGSGLIWIAAALVVPLPRHLLEPPASLRVLDRDGGELRLYVNSRDALHVPVRLAEVSPFLAEATVAFEDHWFFFHPGVNPVAVLRAAIQNFKAGRVVSGGSTLTQQVARLMEQRPRTLPAKLIEAFRATQLELRFSKHAILEYYLNLAPYGGNLQGAAAAARFYFGKPASALGPGEAALLAALPNAPTRLRPDRNPEGARARRNEVLARMYRRGVIDRERYLRSLREPVPDLRREVPMRAPHLGDLLRSRLGQDAGDVLSTIDPAVQESAERLLTRHLERLAGRGIGNGAVVVIENATRAVRALVGSADYRDDAASGQVNGVLAPRSPGSALKPFAYALGFDAGLVTPSMLIEDVPVRFGSYRPQNYDETYRGAITVTDALRYSMNVPAVNLVHRLGVERLYAFLKEGGLNTLDHPWEHYGLPLVLGGGGVCLLELTNLYAMLAEQGIWRPYRLLEQDRPVPGHRMLSPGAVYLLTEILTQIRRPDFPSSWESAVHVPRIAWKTGTSYGHHDAWSIGYTGDHTIGVWMGNFSGEGSPELVGAEAAGPLLFDLATVIEHDGSNWFMPPEGVEEIEVCTLSGLPAGPWCPETRRVFVLAGISPNAPCDMHVHCMVDDESGFRLCPHCSPGRSWHWETFVEWPQSVATWMRENGQPVPGLPPHEPTCTATTAGDGPLIRSPATDIRFVLREDVPLEYQKIRLEASVVSSVRTVHWFVDGELLFQGDPTAQVFWLPRRGRHMVVCVDEEGRSSRRELIVE